MQAQSCARCDRPSVQLVRKRTGWVRLCAGHWEIEWRYWPKARQRQWLRREKRRRRKAEAAKKAAKRVAARKLDGTEGRRKRAGRQTRAEADAAKRAMCAGSERQAKPWVALGVSRRTYYYHKLHGAHDSVAPGSADKTCLTISTCSVPLADRAAPGAAAAKHQIASSRRRERQRPGRAERAQRAMRTSSASRQNPHRFAGGQQRNSGNIQHEHAKVTT